MNLTEEEYQRRLAQPTARVVLPAPAAPLGIPELLEPVADDVVVPAPPTLARKWKGAVERMNFAEMAEEMWREEERGLRNSSMPFSAWWETSRRILASTADEVLEKVCWGNLTYAKRHSNALRKKLEENERRNKDLAQPSIYLFELVKKHTLNSPTPYELLKILRIADRYDRHAPEDFDLINRIDNWIKTGDTKTMQQTRNGDRRYLSIPERHQKYRVLRDNMRALFRGMSAEELDEPLEQPPREVGFAKSSYDRMKQHQKHQGSNYLMNLFDAICGVFWEGQFEVVGHNIYLIWEVKACSMAEVIFTILGSAYTRTGLGFCHQPAGLSNAAGWDSPFNWNDIQNGVRYRSLFVDRIEEDNRKLEAVKARADELAQINDQIADLDLQLEEREADQAGVVDRQLRQELADVENEIALLDALDRDLDRIEGRQ